MKRIVIVLGFMFMLFMQVNKASAEADYMDGWFDHNAGKFSINMPEAIDNNLATYAQVSSTKKLTVTFNEGISIDILSLYVNVANYSHRYHFYNSLDQNIYTHTITLSSKTNSVQNIVLNLKDVKKIVIDRISTSITNVYEIEIFEVMPRNVVGDLKAGKVTHSSANLSWELPKDDDIKGILIKANGEVLQLVEGNAESYTAKGLQIATDYKFEVSVVYTDGTVSNSKEVNITTQKAPTLQEVKAVPTANGANISWSNPISDHKLIRLYKDGVKVTDIAKERISYVLSDLEGDTKYNYQMSYIFEGDIESEKVDITFTTLSAIKEIQKLKAVAAANQIALTWEMPTYTTLDFARIYRKANSSKVASLTATTGEPFKAIFETNGTSFKDLTVESDQQYTYKVTTVDTGNNESEGVQINVTTPKISVIGIDGKEEENGDYILKWEQPTTGTIKVVIGNKEYKIVPAADKQVIIPTKDLKFDPFGTPDVKLIPIDENGKEGEPGGIGDSAGGIKDKVNGIFSANDLLKTAVALLGIVGSFILLALAFKVVPKLINTIKTANTSQKRKVEMTRRTD